MNILIVTQYFYPENFRINDLAMWLVNRGHQVTVLTGIPNYPGGRFFSGYGLWRRREIWNGIKVVRVPLIPRGNGSGIRLLLNFLSFAVTASALGPWLLGRRFDVIFVHEPSPITVGIPAVVMHWRSRAPIFFWVLDLWPDSVAAAGNVRAAWVISSLTRLARWIYGHCEKVLVQSRAFIPRLRAMGVPEERIDYLPNWAEDMFQPHRVERTVVPLPAGFRLLYAGNIGVAQDFPTILAAAERLKNEDQIHWVIIGDGREASWVREEVVRRGLEGTVHLLGSYPPDRMPAFFGHADALLVSLKSSAVFALTIPAKVQAYMACGRPIIAVLEGEGERIIAEAGAGLSCRPGDAAALAKTVLQMARMSSSNRERMGALGREYYESHFERLKLFHQLEEWMNDASRRLGTGVKNGEKSTRLEIDQ